MFTNKKTELRSESVKVEVAVLGSSPGLLNKPTVWAVDVKQHSPNKQKCWAKLTLLPIPTFSPLPLLLCCLMSSDIG